MVRRAIGRQSFVHRHARGRALTGLAVVAIVVSCRPTPRSEPVRLARSPGLAITIPRGAAVPARDDARRPSGPPWAAFVQERVRVADHRAGSVVEQTLLPTASDIRIARLDARGQSHPLADVSIQRSNPPTVGFRPPTDRATGLLVEVLYRVQGLWWYPSYRIDALQVDDGDDGGIDVMCTAAATLNVHNATGVSIPRASLRFVEKDDIRDVWRTTRALGKQGDEWPLYEPDDRRLPGALVHVIRLQSADRLPGGENDAIRARPRLAVGRELILQPPPGHPLRRAPTGRAVVRFPHANVVGATRVEGRLVNERADAGVLRVILEPSDNVRAQRTEETVVRPDGLYRRHVIAIDNRGDALLRVRIHVSLPDTGYAELVSAEPDPIDLGDRHLSFDISVASDEIQDVRYLLYHPH